MSLPDPPPSLSPQSTRPAVQPGLPPVLRAAPEEKTSSKPGGSGLLIGIFLGVLAALWALPPVRYTLGAQLQFALTENGVPWMRAFDSRRNMREAPRLNAAASQAPNDYLMQVGRATALVEAGGVRDDPRASSLPNPDQNDRTLVRLYLLAQQFPDEAGAYAQLARYMTAGRVRIQRAELELPPAAPFSENRKSKIENSPSPSAPANIAPIVPRSIPARRRDVRLMEWALHGGETRDPTNAFWPAMLAVTYFAAERDADGLRVLDRVRLKSNWDAYIYEEVLGQWRLYSAAYGDNGAAQKIGPLSLIAFPHLREIRRMTELARLLADRAAAAGRDAEAIRIRRDISRLGLIMHDTAQWAYEALSGTDLLFIGTTDSDTPLRQGTITTVPAWDREATDYKRLMKRTGRVKELARLRQEIEAACDLRRRVDILRRDASYPGVPPGIPLVSLFGNWMAGVCLLQEILAITAAALLAALWRRSAARWTPRRSRLAFVIAVITAAVGMPLFGGLPSVRTAGVFLAALTGLILLGLDALTAKRRAAGPRPTPNPLPKGKGLFRFAPALNTPPSQRGTSDLGKGAGGLGPAEIETRWTHATTVRLLLVVLLPALAALYFLRPALSSLHPVVALLTSLVGVPRSMTAGEALEIALTAICLPLAITLLSGLWALTQNGSPAAGALIGLRRAALPAVACLVLVYLLLLNRTLRLDAAAGNAIDMAAQNDLQWVLTHGSGGAE